MERIGEVREVGMEVGMIEVIDRQWFSSDESHKKVTIRGCTIRMPAYEHASM